MTEPCFLASPPPAVASRLLPRIRELLWRLREHTTPDIQGQPFGWVHTSRTCTLRNLNLSADCLSLVLQGVKEVYSGPGSAPSGLLDCSPAPIKVRAGGAVMFFAGQNVSCTNIPDAQGEYVALTLSFGRALHERLSQRLPQFSSTAFSSAPCSTNNAVGCSTNCATPCSEDKGVSESLLVALAAFLDLLAAGSDPTLPLMQQEQILYILWTHGVPLLCGPHNLVHQIRHLVEASPAFAWSTGELASRLHMSERTLRRQLEKAGTSASELVRLARLHRGLGMLMRENTHVGEVALRCGYTSASRFAERFREQFGISPVAVRMGRCCRLPSAE